MKIITPEQVERLEKISMAVEHAKKFGNGGRLIQDLEWLTGELRRAYTIIEDMIIREEKTHG